MSRRPSAAWIAPPLLAALTLPAMVGLVAGAPASQTAVTSRPSWSDPVAMAACPAATLPAPGAAPGRHTGAAWSLAPLLAADGELTGWDLVTAAPGRPAAWLRLPVESAVRGPVGGRVAVAEDDGTTSAISLVSPADGCATVVHRDANVVRQAILQPGTGDVVYHVIRRSDRADLGVWRIRPGDVGEAVLVLPPPGPGEDLDAVGPIWATTLHLDRAGGLLAVQSCGEVTCRIRLVDLHTGEVRSLPGGDRGHLVDIDSSRVIAFGACPGLPCPLAATEIRSGRRVELAVGATSASTVLLDGRLQVAAIVRDRGRDQLVLIDPARGTRRSLSGPDVPLSLLPAAAADGGAELAAGWITAIDERDGRPFGLQLASLPAATSEGSR